MKQVIDGYNFMKRATFPADCRGALEIDREALFTRIINFIQGRNNSAIKR